MSKSGSDRQFTEEMRAWMMIQVIGQTSVNFLNIKKLKKEMTEHLQVLVEAAGAGDLAEAKALSDIAGFFPEYFIDTCLTSKTYRTAVFGTMSMSDAGAATRIAQDVIEVTENIPRRFGLEEEARPLRKAMLGAFVSRIENAEAILEELHIEFSEE